MSGRNVGSERSRVEGPLKVTGKVQYTAEYALPRLTHAVLVQSAIASGRVSSLDDWEARSLPGVLLIMTSKDRPALQQLKPDFINGFPYERRSPLQDDRIHYAGQHIALVVAETLEQAQHAASLIHIEYKEEKPVLDATENAASAITPDKFVGREELQVVQGNPDAAQADVRVEERYVTPIVHHNPMEMSATIAEWQGQKLTVHDSTRHMDGSQEYLAQVFGMPKEDVRVICPWIGGAFGSKTVHWHHVALTALAAKGLGRPVKLMLTRAEMFTSTGHRPETHQEVKLGAAKDGRLTFISHETLTATSPTAFFVEPAGTMTRHLYACDNLKVSHRLAEENIAPGTFMRAPGESSGLFGLESALDELAWKLKMDPVELRLRNYAETDPFEKKPWSAKHLRECYSRGAERFGWKRRAAEPGSLRQGRIRIGWGMATAAYPAKRMPASVRAVLTANDGVAVFSSATHDVGGGTYTIMTQIAADAIALPAERIRFELGDTDYPPAPVTGGSITASSVGPAVMQAGESLKSRLIQLAIADTSSALHGAQVDQVVCEEGHCMLKSDRSKSEDYRDILQRARLPQIEAQAQAEPGAEKEQFSFLSFGAHFAEVHVDDLGQVRVARWVGVFDAGRMLNPRTAHSQMLSGITHGIGMALLEHTVYDPNHGNPVNADFSEYLVPVNLDIPEMDISFIDIPDPHFNPVECHGIGELGITGVNAAIANAVFHATGKRIRELPITPEKLL